MLRLGLAARLGGALKVASDHVDLAEVWRYQPAAAPVDHRHDRWQAAARAADALPLLHLRRAERARQ